MASMMTVTMGMAMRVRMPVGMRMVRMPMLCITFRI